MRPHQLSGVLLWDAPNRCAAAGEGQDRAEQAEPNAAAVHRAFMPPLSKRRQNQPHPDEHGEDSDHDSNDSFHGFYSVD